MTEDSPAPKIIYIAGYGRSGSTLLSILLDNLSGVVGVGGVAGLPWYLGVRGRECSCNRFYVNCPAWSKVFRALPGGVKFIREMGAIQRQVEPWNKGFEKMMNNHTCPQYSQKVTEFFRTIARMRRARVLVDASKCAYPYMWRALSLSQTGVEVFVIHLVRGAGEVVSSRKKGRNVDLEREKTGRPGVFASSIGLAGWITANLAAWYTRRYLKKDRSIVVHYEDLIRSPETEIRRIVDRAELPGIDPSTAFRNDTGFEIGHLVGGNRMARQNQTVEVDPSSSTASCLSKFEKFAVAAVSPMEKLISGR